MILKIKSSDSFRHGIASSTILNILAKGATFSCTLILAFYFGAQLQMDLYFFSISLVIAIGGLLNGCSSLIVREGIRIRENEGQASMMAFLNIFCWTLFGLALIPAIMLLLGYTSILKVVSNFQIEQIAIFSRSFKIIAIIIIMSTLAQYLKEVLGIFRYFTIPAFVNLINSLCLITFIFLFHNALGVTSALLGLAIGNLLNLVLLVWLLTTKFHWNFLQVRFHLPREILRRLFFSEMGVWASVGSGFMPSYFLSGMGTGILSAMNFAKQIADIPTQLVTTQFSSVAAIKLNEQHSRNEIRQMQDAFKRSIEFLLFLLTPFTIVCFLKAEIIVQILIAHGSFHGSSIQHTADFVRLFCILPPLLAIDTMVARLYIACGKIGQSFLYQIASNSLMIACMAVLKNAVGWWFYPGSLLIFYGLNIIVQPFLFKTWLPEIKFTIFFKGALKILCINIPLGLGVYGIYHLPIASHIMPSIELGASIIAYGAGILWLNKRFKINNDIEQTIGAILEKLNLKAE